MIEMGAHIEAIKQRLGHSSIRVTSDVYGSLLPTVDESITAGLETRFNTITPHATRDQAGSGSVAP